jgi:hydroxymethylpyrimidine/phosphomethylpyrimidine kinase
MSEVAGVRGRIVKIGNAAVPASYIEFGASMHMASAIIGYMSVNPSFRSVINIRFNDELVKICKKLFSVSSYDRSKEPHGIKKKEGTSVTWGTLQALSKNSGADVIYHEGDVGKEPMITVFGKNPSEVAAKIKAILKNY